MKKILLITLFLFSLTYAVIAQDYKFQLHLEGIQYDSLELFGSYIEDRLITIPGKSTDGKNWDFTIPDSIYDSAAHLTFSPKSKNKEPGIEHEISLVCYINGDTINYGGFTLDRRVTDIQAQYIETQVEEEVASYQIGKLDEGNIYYATIYSDILSIPYFDNTDFAVRSKYSFRYLHDVDNYEEYRDRFMGAIKDYPDSRHLIKLVAIDLQNFSTKEDLQKILGSFSEVNQQSSWGKIIQDYVEHYYTFSNTILPRWDTGDLEPIIQDSTKINLVIFSTSWCKPCREEIPILKEIYSDFKDNIAMTYISLDDEPEYVNNWKELMKKEAIPWRSLLAVNDVKAIKRKYNAYAIPYILLVYPDSDRFDIINVREKADKDKLYSLCGKKY
ncbi:MAG: thioredoxin family protein [Candidatus Symbiothrix sp.]|jgi:thiol-disulfide isomerase/thioredoxin|nr:thioredoxin family protein [Candidatus Symbiothrix sp.]